MRSILCRFQSKCQHTLYSALALAQPQLLLLQILACRLATDYGLVCQRAGHAGVQFCYYTGFHGWARRQVRNMSAYSRYTDGERRDNNAQMTVVKIKNWVRPVWRRTPLFYVTILVTLCIKGLNDSHPTEPGQRRRQMPTLQTMNELWLFQRTRSKY